MEMRPLNKRRAVNLKRVDFNKGLLIVMKRVNIKICNKIRTHISPISRPAEHIQIFLYRIQISVDTKKQCK